MFVPFANFLFQFCDLSYFWDRKNARCLICQNHSKFHSYIVSLTRFAITASNNWASPSHFDDWHKFFHILCDFKFDERFDFYLNVFELMRKFIIHKLPLRNDSLSMDFEFTSFFRSFFMYKILETKIWYRKSVT